MRLFAVLRSLPRTAARSKRPAARGGTRRDFFGDRLATFDELRAANARTDAAPDTAASVPAPARRHVA